MRRQISVVRWLRNQSLFQNRSISASPVFTVTWPQPKSNGRISGNQLHVFPCHLIISHVPYETTVPEGHFQANLLIVEFIGKVSFVRFASCTKEIRPANPVALRHCGIGQDVVSDTPGECH